MMDNDTRVMWTSPLEQMNDAVDAVATKTEFASLSDLGYSLSDIAIRSLDVIHTTTGLPWWATIVATTIAVRGIFFPITIISVRSFVSLWTLVVYGTNKFPYR
jgi:membrane protein insertase Oxa1/YidC/SpoIIIJ